MAAVSGGCRCGAVRYTIEDGEAAHAALCHCGDCRRSSGAPAMAWYAVPSGRVRISGTPTEWSADGRALRRFCGRCGTGLFYVNETVLPGLIDIQMATLDHPEAVAPMAHIQTAERLPWMTGLDALPAFERYPG